MKIKARLPDRERLLRSRWIRPFAHRLRDPRLWHLSRESAARGIALGLFIGFLAPLGQTPLAALLAVPARAHLLTAAAATFVTNPLTVPIVYFAAIRSGERLLARLGLTAESGESLAAAPHGIIEQGLALAASLAAGLLVFAIASAVVAHFGVRLGWRLRTVWRWTRRGYRAGALQPDPRARGSAGSRSARDVRGSAKPSEGA